MGAEFCSCVANVVQDSIGVGPEVRLVKHNSRLYGVCVWQILIASPAAANSSRGLVAVFIGTTLDLEKSSLKYGREALWIALNRRPLHNRPRGHHRIYEVEFLCLQCRICARIEGSLWSRVFSSFTTISPNVLVVILLLAHPNIAVPDQTAATLFY